MYIKMSALLLMFSFSVWSQTYQNNQYGNNNNNNQNPNQAQGNNSLVQFECGQEIKAFALPATTTAKTPVSESCQALNLAAKMNGRSLQTGLTQKPTLDGRAVCVQRTGYTLDYDHCVKVANLYSSVVIAEKAMFETQSLISQNKNATIQAEAMQKTAAGNGQTAAYDAAYATSKNLQAMNTQQAGVYTTAVGLLSASVASWPKNKASYFEKFCNANPGKIPAAMKEVGGAALGVTQCVELLSKANAKDEMFANETARAAFFSATAEFFQKGAAAGILAMKNKNAADQLEKAAAQVAATEDLQLDQCVFTPNTPACIAAAAAGSKSAIGGNFAGNSISLGAAGNNSFNMDPNGDSTFGTDENPAVDGTQTVGNVSNPFEDQAKKANGILNPAAAATMNPGGAGAGAAPPGGGGGGGGGGGSAALGDDLEGAKADENKDPEIKTNKSTVSYASKGGTKFEAIKGSKEEANPFASLFGDKSNGGGGIEEDRSIASQENDKSKSSLFDKISKRYGQVAADKRIEGNLE